MAFATPEDQERRNLELARFSEVTGNSYLEDFGLSWEYLKDKKALDIGGNDGSFAAAAKLHGADVTTVDMYPHVFAEKGVSDKASYVGADVYHLPFKNESFDFVCARYMTPSSSATDFDDHVSEYLNEVMRTVKDEGEFRVLPAPFTRGMEQVSLDELQSLGYSVTLAQSGGPPYYIFRK